MTIWAHHLFSKKWGKHDALATRHVEKVAGTSDHFCISQPHSVVTKGLLGVIVSVKDSPYLNLVESHERPSEPLLTRRVLRSRSPRSSLITLWETVFVGHDLDQWILVTL